MKKNFKRFVSKFNSLYLNLKNIKRSLKYTIIISFTIVILLPTLIYSFYFLYSFSNTYKTTAQDTYNSFVSENLANINYQYDNITNTSLSVLVNSNIIDILDTNINESYEKIILQSKFEKELSPLLLFNPAWNNNLIKSIFLMKDTSNYYYIFKDNTDMLKNINNSLEIIENNISSDKLPFVIADPSNTSSIYLLRECFDLSTAECKGYLLLELDSSILFDFEILKNNYNSLQYLIYDTDTNNIILNPTNLAIGQVFSDITNSNVDSNVSTIKIENTKFLVSNHKITNSNLSSILLVKYDDVFANLEHTMAKYIFVFAIITAICLLIFFKMYHGFSDPLLNLLDCIKKIQYGNFQAKMPDYSFDELNNISLVFNNMSNEIVTLINQVYDKQLLIKESELKFLKSQIDPHFIFNVLDTINWHAKLDNNQTICELTTNLSKLLRANINFNGNETIPLKEELEYINFYIRLQKSRFQDRLNFKLTIADDSILNYKVPKLCIQPLIENAIIHGLEPKPEGGNLSLQIWEEENDLYLLIIDDGIGFDSNKILSSCEDPIDLRKKGHKSIALHNILRRLDLLYEENYSFNIDSKPGNGCKIRVSVPLDKED